jgi:AcrR family transcriptional regulator
MQLADEMGISALTMRALGEHLGVDPTAVYRHFPNKESLLDAMLDRILAEAVSIEPEGETSRERIISVAVNVRSAMRQHPNLAGAFASATGNFPHGLTITRRMIAELRGLGLSGEHLVRMYQTLEGYILGSSVFDTGGYPETFTIRQARYRYLNEPEFDQVARTAEDVERVTEEAFIHAITTLLDACEELAEK